MTICRCGHDEMSHSEDGEGYCFANKPNGEPCQCERFSEKRREQVVDLQLRAPRLPALRC